MSQLFLTFLGDGPLWDNIVKVPAYPSGFSYYRPFRYRDRWVQPELLSEIQSGAAIQSIANQEAILCTRFLTEGYKGHLLPVRKVRIVKVNTYPDNHSIYFSLGSFFNLEKYENLAAACLVLPPTGQTEDISYLFFRSGITVPDSGFLEPSQDAKAWVEYSDRIAQDQSLPINNEARKSLFLHFEIPEGKQAAPVSTIHESKNSGTRYGPVLLEGQSYEFTIAHRIPYLHYKNTSVKPFMMDITSPTSNIEISPTREEISGNYQVHIITIFPKKPSGAWEEILISPLAGAETQEGIGINTISINMPVKTIHSLSYRFRNIYVWLGLVWLGLLCSVFLEKILGITGNESNYLVILGVALSTLLASIAIFILQQKGVSVK